jgi:c-di-GMP-binding flagellar brake protein YcgR
MPSSIISTSFRPLPGLPSHDRRKSSRVCEGFPIVVRGLDTLGEPFEGRTFLENLSAGGMYFLLSELIPLGSEIYVVIELRNASKSNCSTVHLAAQGLIVRAEPGTDGTQGFAVKFTKHRVF